MSCDEVYIDVVYHGQNIREHHKCYTFTAPAAWGIRPGDSVKVSTRGYNPGVTGATVIRVSDARPVGIALKPILAVLDSAAPCGRYEVAPPNLTLGDIDSAVAAHIRRLVVLEVRRELDARARTRAKMALQRLGNGPVD